MAADGWRYYAFKMNGDGTETPLHNSLPLNTVTLDTELSGPGGISASLPLGARKGLGTNADELLLPWSTAIYAERSGQIRQGGILTNVEDAGAGLKLDCVGFSGYLNGQPYTGDYSGVQVDPLALVRLIWSHAQTKAGGNLGIVVDGTTSPVRVGKAAVDGNTSREEGPFILGWWETHDLGKVIDDLATDTPFDYHITHTWDGDRIVHRLQLGYPSIGRRRTDLRFVLGENVFTQPTVDYEGEDYADEVLVLGAGEGRKMVRGLQQRQGSGRLRRTVVVEDKTRTDQAAANRAALDELSYRLGSPDLQSLVLTNHPHAPIGSYTVGDEILVTTREGWHDGLSLWVRILAVSTDTEGDVDTLTVARSEKGNR